MCNNKRNNKIEQMKTKQLIVGLILASSAFLAFADRECSMNCTGNTSMDSCGTGPGCQTSGWCYKEYFDPGYTTGTCSSPSNDWEDGCNDGKDVPINTTTYFGTCSSACVCQVPPGTQPFSDHGYGAVCWQDCCSG